jgi:hypothetical protein
LPKIPFFGKSENRRQAVTDFAVRITYDVILPTVGEPI